MCTYTNITTFSCNHYTQPYHFVYIYRTSYHLRKILLQSTLLHYSQRGDGNLKNQPNEIGTTPQYFHTIPTSCAILQTLHTTKLYMHMHISLPTPKTQTHPTLHTHQHGTPQLSMYKTTHICHTQQQYVKPRAHNIRWLG